MDAPDPLHSRSRPAAAEAVVRSAVELACGESGWDRDGPRRGVAYAWLSLPDRAPEHVGLQCAAAAVAWTRSLRIVLAGLPWPPAALLRTAEDLATLDALSGGRLEVGLRPGPDLAAAREDLALLRGAWSRTPLDHQSARHRLQGVDVHPKPAQAPGPPLWLCPGAHGAGGPEAAWARWAREEGLGLRIARPDPLAADAGPDGVLRLALDAPGHAAPRGVVEIVVCRPALPEAADRPIRADADGSL